MLCVNEDAVICDLAETYGVLDMRAVPVKTLAALCVGLRDDSRIKMALMGYKRIAPSFALVRIADTLSLLAHSLVGKEGSPTPQLYGDIMAGKQEKQSGYDTVEAFEAARKRIISNG